MGGGEGEEHSKENTTKVVLFPAPLCLRKRLKSAEKTYILYDYRKVVRNVFLPSTCREERGDTIIVYKVSYFIAELILAEYSSFATPYNTPTNTKANSYYTSLNMSQQDATSQAETHSATDELKRVIKYCFWEFGQEENVPEDRLDRYFCIVSYLTQAGVKLPDAFEEHGGKVALFKALIVGGRAWMNQENEIERRTRYNGLIKLAEVCYERLFGEVFDEYTVQVSVVSF